MTSISIQDAQQQLVALIHGLAPGEEVVITENDRAVARLTPATDGCRKPVLGGMRGTVLYMADDFDAPLKGFGESEP